MKTRRTPRISIALALLGLVLAGCSLPPVPVTLSLNEWLTGSDSPIVKEVMEGIAVAERGEVETSDEVLDALGRGGLRLASVGVGGGEFLVSGVDTMQTGSAVALERVRMTVWLAPSTAANLADPSTIATPQYLAYAGTIAVVNAAEPDSYTISEQSLANLQTESATLVRALESGSFTVYAEFAALDGDGNVITTLNGALRLVDLEMTVIVSLSLGGALR